MAAVSCPKAPRAKAVVNLGLPAFPCVCSHSSLYKMATAADPNSSGSCFAAKCALRRSHPQFWAFLRAPVPVAAAQQLHCLPPPLCRYLAVCGHRGVCCDNLFSGLCLLLSSRNIQKWQISHQQPLTGPPGLSAASRQSLVQKNTTAFSPKLFFFSFQS